MPGRLTSVSSNSMFTCSGGNDRSCDFLSNKIRGTVYFNTLGSATHAHCSISSMRNEHEERRPCSTNLLFLGNRRGKKHQLEYIKRKIRNYKWCCIKFSSRCTAEGLFLCKSREHSFLSVARISATDRLRISKCAVLVTQMLQHYRIIISTNKSSFICLLNSLNKWLVSSLKLVVRFMLDQHC